MTQHVPLILAVIGGIIYGIAWYGRAYAKDNEPLNIPKFLATLLVSAVVGASAGMAGLALTEQGMAAQLTSYIGIISLLEAVLKTIYYGPLDRPDPSAPPNADTWNL